MSTDADSLPDDLDQLRAVLLAERAQHEATVIQHEATLAQIEATVSSQQRTIQQQEQTIARLLRKMYGPQQERIDPNQLTLFDADELEELAEELAAKRSPAASSLARKRGHGRRPLPRNLPREQVVHELPEAQRQCPCCGEVRQEIGRETSEQLEYIPGTMKVIEHVRWGVVLRRSTLCGWIAAAADLVQPLVKRMQQLLLASHVIHTDDTSVKLLDPLIGHARTARFWAYIGDSAHPYSIYDFTDSRQRDGPAKFLKDFSGYLQADAYGGYDGIYSGGKVREVACWAHARRYWWEARTTDPRRAHHALGLIARLYQLEATFAGLSPEARCAARQEHAAPILTEFGRWLEEQRSGPVPKSPVGQAVTYTLNQWQALVRYTEDGALAIDNNVSERTVKIPAIGRKNWLFVASREGGRRAAALFSLVASCKANQVEPWAYLRDVFTRLPQLGESLPSAALDSLLPDRWLADHPQHRWQIDHLRRQERDKKAVRHR
jgi:transposase